MIVLVTGASAVIGAAAARRFAAEGGRVLLTARSEGRLRALAGAAYSDTRPLTPEDVADAIGYCVKAPARVNVQELLVQPRVQSGSRMLARGEAARGL